MESSDESDYEVGESESVETVASQKSDFESKEHKRILQKGKN